MFFLFCFVSFVLCFEFPFFKVNFSSVYVSRYCMDNVHNCRPLLFNPPYSPVTSVFVSLVVFAADDFAVMMNHVCVRSPMMPMIYSCFSFFYPCLAKKVTLRNINFIFVVFIDPD